MFNCYQAVGMTCCTAGKGTREGEKASMHVKVSPGMLHIVGYLSPVLQITKPFELSSHVPVWVFLKEFVCFLFLRITEVMSLKKKQKQKASLFAYIELNCKGLFSNFIPLH